MLSNKIRSVLEHLRTYGYFVTIYSKDFPGIFEKTEQPAISGAALCEITDELHSVTMRTFSAMSLVHDDSLSTSWEFVGHETMNVGYLYKVVRSAPGWMERNEERINTGISVNKSIGEQLVLLLNSQNEPKPDLKLNGMAPTDQTEG